MRKVKEMLLLIIGVFMLCGCSVTYNLTIDESSIKEETLIHQDNSNLEELNALYLDKPVNYNVFVEDDDIESIGKENDIYVRKFVAREGGIDVRYYYDKFNKNTISSSFAARKAFTNVGYYYDKGANTIQLSTNNGSKAFFEYPELDNLTINITTSYNVRSHNATSVKGNTYTWNFSKDDNSKNIVLVMDIEKKDEEDKTKPKEDEQVKEDEDESKTSSWQLILIFIIGFIIVLFILFKINNSK